MDEQHEREQIREKSMRMCEYLAKIGAVSLPQRELKDAEHLTREEEVYVNRCSLQLGQILTLNSFITAAAEGCLRLLRKPERAEEIGREGLETLHGFLEEYTGLLAEEYSWCQ